MSLFDFIAKELSIEDKRDLFSDKIVCLCFFQVSLNPLEQQLLYKLLFMNDSISGEGFKPKEFAQDYMQNPKLMASQTGKSMQRLGTQSVGSHTYLQSSQTQQTGKPVDFRLELSKNFFKKLQRLDLLEQCEEVQTKEKMMRQNVRGL